MTVIRITEYRDRDTINVLEDLLKRAKRGEVRGICFAIKTDIGHHGIGLTGEYITDPTDVLAVVSRIDFEVNMLIREHNATNPGGEDS
jgi:hypothetical protein